MRRDIGSRGYDEIEQNLTLVSAKKIGWVNKNDYCRRSRKEKSDTEIEQNEAEENCGVC